MENNTKTAKVATHSVKNCRVTFGALVGFDAKIMSAAREEGSGFKMVVKTETGAIVPASQIYTANGKYYNFQDVGRAIENGDGSYLWVEQADINACKCPSSDEIAITEFFPMSQVDPIFFDKGYFIAPDPGKLKKGAVANENNQASIAYTTLLESMKEAGLAAKAKMEIKGKEHNVIIRIYNDGTQDLLMLHTIYTSSDVRTVNILRPTVAISPATKTLCGQLIESMTTNFDRTAVVSESDARYNALIERKRAEALGMATPTTPGASSTAAAADSLEALLAASLAMTAKAKGIALAETVVEPKVETKAKRTSKKVTA